MGKIFATVEDLTVNIKEYIRVKIASAKLSVAEKTSAVVANIIAGIAVIVIFVLFFLFASIALAIGIGIWLDKLWLGFLILACFYLLLGILLWVMRSRWIRFPLMNSIVHQLTKDDEDDENDK